MLEQAAPTPCSMLSSALYRAPERVLGRHLAQVCPDCVGAEGFVTDKRPA